MSLFQSSRICDPTFLTNTDVTEHAYFLCSTIPRCNELEMGIDDELKRKLVLICLRIYILYTVFTITNGSWCDDRIERIC